MRIVFFGIYDIGVRSLTSLLSRKQNIVAVVTKPDSAVERQPVADCATAQGLTLFQPESPKQDDFVREITSLRPDLMIVAGYHKVIPGRVLSVPAWGTINLHGSLLPKYRGPCPWKHAIANGEETTGVTVHIMTTELDRGDVLAQRRIPIDEDDTGASLFAKISDVGARVLTEVVDQIQSGEVTKTPQVEESATYQGYPSEEETRIDWHAGAEKVRNLARGMYPSPRAWTVIKGLRIKVGKVFLTPQASNLDPGTIVQVHPDRLQVATSTSDVIISELTAGNNELVNVSDLGVC